MITWAGKARHKEIIHTLFVCKTISPIKTFKTISHLEVSIQDHRFVICLVNIFRWKKLKCTHSNEICIHLLYLTMLSPQQRALKCIVSRLISFRGRFSQCVDYMRFNEKWFCFRWQETTKLIIFDKTETSSLVILCNLRCLMGNISSVMTIHMGVQRKLHHFTYLIVIFFCFF